MKRGKRRIDDAIVLANGIGIISGKTSYILKEKKENEEDKFVFMKKSYKYLEKRERIFEKKYRVKLRGEQEESVDVIYRIITPLFMIATIVIFSFWAQIDSLDLRSILQRIQYAFFIWSFCFFISGHIYNLGIMLNYDSEKKLAKKRNALNRAINVYIKKERIPGILDVAKERDLPKTKCKFDLWGILGNTLMLIGMVIKIIEYILFCTSLVSTYIILIICIIYIGIKFKPYNVAAIQTLPPSEKEISEAILLLEFFVENQKNSSTK